MPSSAQARQHPCLQLAPEQEPKLRALLEVERWQAARAAACRSLSASRPRRTERLNGMADVTVFGIIAIIKGAVA
jgi:hypothetical protein